MRKWLLLMTVTSMLILGACGNETDAIADEETGSSELAKLHPGEETSDSPHAIEGLSDFGEKESMLYISEIVEVYMDLRTSPDLSIADEYKKHLSDYTLFLYEGERQFEDVKQSKVIKKLRTYIKKQVDFNEKMISLIDDGNSVTIIKTMDKEFPDIAKARGEYAEEFERYMDEL